MTRRVDLAKVAVSAGSWFAASQGTLFGQFVLPFTAKNQFIADLNDGTASSRIGMYARSAGGMGFEVLNSNTGEYLSYAAGGSIPTGVVNRSIITYQASNFARSLNGSAATTASSGAVPTITQLQVGAYNNGSFYTNGWIQNIRYYNTRLSNSALSGLTAP
jgi:hypothetical protein